MWWAGNYGNIQQYTNQFINQTQAAVVFRQFPYDALISSLNASVAAGNGPDIAIVGNQANLSFGFRLRFDQQVDILQISGNDAAKKYADYFVCRANSG